MIEPKEEEIIKNCFTCGHFDFLKIIIKEEKPCKFYPAKLSHSEDIMSAYFCEHYKEISVEKHVDNSKMLEDFLNKLFSETCSSKCSDNAGKLQCVLSNCCQAQILVVWDSIECRYCAICEECGSPIMKIRAYEWMM